MEIKNKTNTLPRIEMNSSSAAAEKQLRDVSALYEKQFLREMVKQMRASVGESEFMPAGFAEKYYREELDHQYVESWGDQGGIGLGKMIYDQLISKYGEMLGIKVPSNKAMGPLSLSQKDQWGARMEPKDKSIVFTKKEGIASEKVNSQDTVGLEKGSNSRDASSGLEPYEKRAKENGSTSVESPWAGRWLGSFELDNGLKVAKIQHDGFQSMLVGNFQPSSLKVGEALPEGAPIGVLAPEAKQLQWKVVKTEN